MYTRPPTRPIVEAAQCSTLLQDAVIATRPARIELLIFEGSLGIIYYASVTFVYSNAEKISAEHAGARRVLMKIVPGLEASVISTTSYADAVLKKSHPVTRKAPPTVARGTSLGS